MLNVDLVDDLAEVPGGQRLFLIFLLGEEYLSGVDILDIRVDLVQLIQIAAVSKEGGWEGGDYLHYILIELTDGVHVWLFE